MSYLHSLSVFFAVIEEGSFSAAAKKLSLTQPTISFHIDNLEKRLNCQLFIRTAKGVQPTIYGQKLRDNTFGFNDILTVTENQIKAMVAGSAGLVTIGASSIPGEYILPRLVAEFMSLNPGLRLSIKTGDSGAILAAFRQGTLPIAIIGMQPEGDIPCTPVWHDEIVLAAHPQLHLDFELDQDTASLIRCPFIGRSDTSGTFRTAMKELAAVGVPVDKLEVIMRVGGNEALKAAIMSKIGVGFISRWAIQHEVSEGRIAIVNVPGVRILRQFYAIHTTPLEPACVQAFWNFLASHTELS